MVRPWQTIDRAEIPGTSSTLSLMRRGEEWVIDIDGTQLMSSRQHSSEDALATLALAAHPAPRDVQVLIGGLGMGFTLAAALGVLGPKGRCVVRELVPGVVQWNRDQLGDLAGHPLQDPRTVVEVGDVQEAIRGARSAWDAILLDVDNSPRGLTRRDNDNLYSPGGLGAASRALRPGGVLAVWSIERDDAFTRSLRRAGFEVDVRTVRAHKGKGARHTIWLARRRR